MNELSVRIRDKRGNRGLRDVAAEISKQFGTISPATLSRIEAGKQPDIETFTKLCRWLEVDPNTILGIKKETSETVRQDHKVYAHFKADKTMSPETATHLANMILAVQEQYQKN